MEDDTDDEIDDEDILPVFRFDDSFLENGEISLDGVPLHTYVTWHNHYDWLRVTAIRR